MKPLPNVLLLGAPGGGKTYSLRSIVKDTDLTLFGVFTEPGMDTFHGISCSDGFHYAYCRPTTGDWKAALGRARKMNQLSWDAITKIPDPQKKEYDSMIKIMENCENFKCDACGESFGDVTEWGNDRAFFIDSLSGINTMAMSLVVGGCLIKSQPQWGAAMDFEMSFINKLCYDTNCLFIMTAHLERLTDEVMGGFVVQANALGRKNAPEIPKNFSDVVLCRREGKEWVWVTDDPKVDLKARNLPYSAKLPPTFKPILDHWRTENA